MKILFRGGVIHTPHDPGATALLVNDDRIAWIGHEGAVLAHADGVDHTVDLGGALVTPAFVDSHFAADVSPTARVALLEAAAQAGIAAVHEFAADWPGEQSPQVGSQLPAIAWYRTGEDAIAPDPRATGRVGPDSADPDLLAEFLLADKPAGTNTAFFAQDEERVGAVLTALGVVDDRLSANSVPRERLRLEGLGPVSEAQIRQLADFGVTASLQPTAEFEPHMNRWRSLTTAGVAIALGGYRQHSLWRPWRSLAQVLAHPDPKERVTARAAFNAATRGGWRAIGQDDQGVLVPGAYATLAIWRASDLVVQEPDDRVSRWSTDPRSGSPVLPVIAADEPDPVCLATYRDGHVLFARPGFGPESVKHG